MIVIIKRELKNYVKNPIYYIGILLVFFEVFQILNPYLKLHYWENDKQVEAAKLKNIGDADIMEGYLPTTEEERIEIALPQIFKELEEMGISVKETEELKEMFLQENYGEKKITQYMAEQYDYMGADYYIQEAELRQGTAEEVNAYMKDKFSQMRYSQFFAKKFADFAGLFIIFFAIIIMAFLFLQDTRKNTYELLHTKPVTSWQYVTGKLLGGFTALLLPLFAMAAVFTVLCMKTGIQQGFPVAAWDLFTAAAVYILPNLFLVICVYALVALLFKNPLPATPLLFLYLIYSNMGSYGPDGTFGYYGRPLAILVRFPGLFLDTAPPPLALMNQTALLFAAAGITWLCVCLWKKRRVYR